MATDKLGLPKITGNMTADVVRDLNALADAVDEKAGQAGGLATLGADGKVPAGQLNVDTSNLATKTELTTGLSGKVDKVEGKQLSTEDYTTAEKSKLAGIEAGANKYTHPSTHPASMITESTSRRFVSDAKIAEWDGKETPTGAQAKVDALAGAGNTRTVKQIGEDLDAHKADEVHHITYEERTKWNNPAQSKLSDGITTIEQGINDAHDSYKKDFVYKFESTASRLVPANYHNNTPFTVPNKRFLRISVEGRQSNNDILIDRLSMNEVYVVNEGYFPNDGSTILATIYANWGLTLNKIINVDDTTLWFGFYNSSSDDRTYDFTVSGMGW